ncbi:MULTISPECIES: MSC_0775 family lipoprotein [unclassified Mycoplasma]|uniref:MSC_0775 family lipoprotein n=1 Tax=unclassified Mycoplasma TaxID=2683645 RepID=UPI00211BECCE|nr:MULTISPECIES: hypothetical protein [unclassified Mycoplasma]UUM20139.1 hypothetical protein NPA11_01800 [Mycoplasma sp. 1578d]UUM25119.1 hypothetical protein NPA12_01775 [Mycoplasma sp. 3686d]
MKKYWIFKKFILPISVLSGVSSSLILASCNSNTSQEPKINLSKEISSSNMLDDIQAKFNLTSSSEFFKFPENVDVSKIKFVNFVTYNYIGQFVKFDQNHLRSLLKKQFPKQEKFIDGLKFEIKYHSIRQNIDNKNQTLIPINIIHEFKDKKHLYEYRTVDFVVNNLGSGNEPKLQKLTNELNILTQLVNQNKPTIQVANEQVVQQVLQNYRLDELSNEQLNKLFKLTLTEVVNKKINDLWDKNHYMAKIFVNGISFDSTLNKAFVSIRVSISDNSAEVTKVLEKRKPQDPKLTRDDFVTGLGSFSNLNIGDNVKVELDYSQTALNSFLLNEQLSSLIKINIKDNSVATYNFKEMNLSDFSVYLPEQFSGLMLEKTKVIDAKNADFTFKLIDSKTKKEYTFTKHLGLGKYVDIFKPDFEEANPKAYNFVTGPLTKENLSKVNPSIFSEYGNKILSGGYDDLRGFYASSPKFPYQLHLGEDYLAPRKTPIIAPYDGEILGIVFHDYKDKTKHFGEGIGTTLLMRIKTADLDISPREREMHFKDAQYVYMGIIHLDQELTFKNQELGISSQQINQISKIKKLVNNKVVEQSDETVDTYATVLDPNTNKQVAITPKNPLKVKKGQVIAYIGDPSENGGWMTHAHISIVVSGTKNWNENGFWSAKKDYYENRLKSYDPQNPDLSKHSWAGIRVPGVYFSQLDQKRQVNSATPKIDSKTGDPILSVDNKGIDSGFKYSFAIFPIENLELRDSLRNPNILFKIRTKETFTFDINTLFNIEK